MMRFNWLGVSLMLLFAVSSAPAQTETLSPALAPIGFLVGSWDSDQGQAEHGQPIRGTSRIEPAAGGTALLRRDHTQTVGRDGAPSRAFGQIMIIYPEDGRLCADYFDGDHAIHYRQAEIQPGRSVRFVTAASPGAPMFRLTYAKIATERLSITFEMAPPGQTEFRTLAEGTARKVE